MTLTMALRRLRFPMASSESCNDAALRTKFSHSRRSFVRAKVGPKVTRHSCHDSSLRLAAAVTIAIANSRRILFSTRAGITTTTFSSSKLQRFNSPEMFQVLSMTRIATIHVVLRLVTWHECRKQRCGQCEQNCCGGLFESGTCLCSVAMKLKVL
ncbi:hypothetical protein EDB89DRAFT_1301081 [Lactarius sanguifluus]|nr:hypothetical protein EDB89DRAFT_1301081 [Lactarius sanguifluus]